jgi:outer membrane protein TolC
LFVNLGRSGSRIRLAGRSPHGRRGLSHYTVGLLLEYPLGNRDAEARHRRATLDLERSREALDNLAQLVEVDVRNAYLDVLRSKEEIAATTATRQFREEALRAEKEKFNVGKSTTLLVAQAQRDYLVSQLAENRSVINHLHLVTLYAEGSMLETRASGRGAAQR